MTNDAKSRQHLAQQANQARSRLLSTLDRLDEKRHGALSLRAQLERGVWQVAIAVGLTVTVSAGVIAFAMHRLSTAAARRRRARWHLAKRVWKQPERALRAERRSFFGEIARSVLLHAATAIAAVPVQRAVAVLVESRREPAAR